MRRSTQPEFGIEANIPMNPRNATTQERDEYFDDELYKRRTVIEHTFAWLDSFKSLLVRYENKLKNWTAMNAIGFIVIFIRRILTSPKMLNNFNICLLLCCVIKSFLWITHYARLQILSLVLLDLLAPTPL